jgi:hypothetical protein
VATANGKTASATMNEMPALAQKVREQLVSTVQQSQQLSLDATQSWLKAVSVLPVMDLPVIPGLRALPDLEAATKFTFDLAAELLNLQREFALQMVRALVPSKKV